MPLVVRPDCGATFVPPLSHADKKVFPQTDVVGWYLTAPALGPELLAVHKKIMEFNESPVLLLLDPVVRPGRKELPVQMLESGESAPGV